MKFYCLFVWLVDSFCLRSPPHSTNFNKKSKINRRHRRVTIDCEWRRKQNTGKVKPIRPFRISHSAHFAAFRMSRRRRRSRLAKKSTNVRINEDGGRRKAKLRTSSSWVKEPAAPHTINTTNHQTPHTTDNNNYKKNDNHNTVRRKSSRQNNHNKTNNQKKRGKTVFLNCTELSLSPQTNGVKIVRLTLVSHSQ